MKIIYCHHGERAVDPRKLRSQDDDLTDNGIKDAELVSEMLAHMNITAIYTSNFYRCKKTAQIINRQLNVPIYEEPRFNEVGSVEGEDWKECLERNIEALNDLTVKYNDDATILCVASSVNLSAFVCWNYKLKPTKDIPFIGATTCAPIVFYTPALISYRERNFERDGEAIKYKKNKSYFITAPTSSELKTYLKTELREKANQMEMFTNKLKREQYLEETGQWERSQDIGEFETKKHLSNRLAIDIMQIIKDMCLAEDINFDTVRTTTALELNEEQCIKNIITYTERLFYIDTNIHETLMLIYSTLVSYINYNDLIYGDIEKACLMVEKAEGSYYNGKLIYKL